MVSTGTRTRLKGNLSLSSGHIQSGRAVKFMSAASAAACAIALSSAAAAQLVPDECTASSSPLASGSTILCVASGTITGPVSGEGVDDLTVVVGHSDIATTLTSGSSSTAVVLLGTGVQTLTVTNSASVVTGTEVGADIEVGEGPGALIVNSQGTISGGSTGIEANNYSTGVTSITTADVNGDTGSGIDVTSDGGDVIVNTAAGTVTGGTFGVSVNQSGDGGISIATADVMAGSEAGVFAQTFSETTGNVVIDTTAGTVTSDGDGIQVYNSGSGDLSITTADVVGGRDGIQVRAGAYSYGGGPSAVFSGDIVINTTAGSVTGGDDGIEVENAGAGGISITTGNVASTGLASDGDTYADAAIIVTNGRNSLGDVTINTVAGTVAGGDGGIVVENAGTGGISITTADVSAAGNGEAYAFNGVGIAVQNTYSSAGNIVIDSTAGTVTGTAAGIFARSVGQGDVAITTADVSGGYVGIRAVSYGESASLGSITINTVAGTVVGGEAGIQAQSTGGISITTADVSATGHGEAYTPFDGVGIFAVNFGEAGGIVINTSAGTVTGGRAGIYAVNLGHGDIAITTADVSGGFIGIVASNPSFYYDGEDAPLGGITVNTVAGTIAGQQTGIVVHSRGAGGISITTADVSAAGGDFGEAYLSFNGVGIGAESTDDATGDIVIDSRAGTVSGGNVGIIANNYGTGSITVATGNVTGGNVGIEVSNGDLSEGAIVINSVGTVSGDDAGIRAGAVAGEISITANNVTSATGSAIEATLGAEVATFARAPIGTTGDLVVNTNGTVVGSTSGILLNNFGTGSSTVNNAGVLSATDGPAILAFGAPATVNNSGTVNGFVTLTDGDDQFNNTGLFNAGVGNDFGVGTDVFNNRGTLAVTTQAPVELAGLESFNNSGLVDLRNGQTGTVLTLPGDYVGSGNATVALDIENGASGPASDVLVIAGAATGQTGIIVNVLGSAGNELALENLLLVDAGAGSSASAFNIAIGFEEQGFLRLGVKHDEAANNYVLVLGPSLAAHRTSLYAEGMRNLWYKTADSWSRHMASVRNTQVEPGTSYWISAVGEFSERANKQAIAFNDSTQIEDLGYNQDYFGAQLGVDLNAGTGFNFGITGGYLSSTQKFNGSTDRVKYNSVNIGAYAGFTSGIVFANVLAKYDRVWADAHSIGGRFDETLKGGVYGGRAEVGLTFGDAATGFYAEPAASISYIGSNLDRLVTEQGSVEFVEDEGLLGKFGGRVGYAGFAGTSLYLGANLVREFAGDDSVNLRTAGRSFSLANYSERNYAETMVGLNLGDPTGMASGVFELRYSDGGDRKGFGGSATVNFKF